MWALLSIWLLDHAPTGWWLFDVHQVDLIAAAQNERLLQVLLPVPLKFVCPRHSHTAHGTQDPAPAYPGPAVSLQDCSDRGLRVSHGIKDQPAGWHGAHRRSLSGNIKLHAAGPGTPQIDTHAHLVRSTSDGIDMLALAPLVPVAGAGSGASTSSRSASSARSSACTCRQVALLHFLQGPHAIGPEMPDLKLPI